MARNTNTGALPLPFFTESTDEGNQRQERARAHNPEFDLHFLALAQLRGIGLNSIRALIDHYGDLAVVWGDNPDTIRDVLQKARIPASQALAEEISTRHPSLLGEGRQLREFFAKRNIRVIACNNPLFPRRLLDIPDAPRWLFVEGDPAIMNDGTFIAVVGTRKATNAGAKTAEQITWLAARAGIGLVSGLAEGIDAAAHAMAARYSVPQVAVLGTGINITFPTSTSHLRRQILETGGCVVTEYLPNENYGKSHFVQRNRIQAGLSEAICPVEGRAQSGTMHTVRFSNKYSRSLFGVTRGTPMPDNDLPSLLKEMGCPVFDIEGQDGQVHLRSFLDQLPGPRFPTPERPSPEFLLRNVLKAIDVISSYDELTHDEKVYLLEQMRERLGLDKN